MSLLQLTSAALLVAGLVFFVAGAAGLLRFPDVHTRLHAVAKADNVGLGLIVVSLMLRADRPSTAAKLLLVWLLVLLASATSAYVIALRAVQEDAGR